MTFIKGGVIDRLDCLIVMGCFLCIYVSMLAYKNVEKDRFDNVMQMVDKLSDEMQKQLYYALKQDV